MIEAKLARFAIKMNSSELESKDYDQNRAYPTPYLRIFVFM